MRSNIRIRLLAVEKILENGLPYKTEEIIKILKDEYNISVERKSLQQDIKALQYFYNIKNVKHRYWKWY